MGEDRAEITLNTKGDQAARFEIILACWLSVKVGGGHFLFMVDYCLPLTRGVQTRS